MLLMLGIISFVTLSYLHFTYKGMLIASGVFAAIIGIGYVIRKILVNKGIIGKKKK